MFTLAFSSRFTETVRTTEFKLFPEGQSRDGNSGPSSCYRINRPHLPAEMWSPGHTPFLSYNCSLTFFFQMTRAFILFGHL